MSEPVVTSLAERAAVLESALEESIPFEEASKKRKKSGSAASPSVRLETSSLETKVAAGSKPSVERMDVGPTGWGDEGPSPATPLDWSNEIVSNPGGIHTHLNEKSSPSKRANKNRHRRGQAQGAQPLWGVAKGRAQGSKRVEAPPHESGWEERTSGSSEATDLRASHGSSVGASGEEALNGGFQIFASCLVWDDLDGCFFCNCTSGLRLCIAILHF